MKLLVVGTDRNLFSPDAPVRKRVIEQGDLVDELRIVVFSLRGSHFVDEKLSDHVFLHPTNSFGRFFYVIDALRVAYKILRDKNGWLISTQDPFECGVVGYILSVLLGVPLHVQLHTDPFSSKWRSASTLNTLRYLVGVFILTRAKAIRVVSERAKRGVVATGVRSESITVVPIYTETRVGPKDVSDLHALYPGYEKIVLSVGRLEKEKDFATLLRAFSEVQSAHPGTLLLIVGSGSQHDRLVELSEWLNIDKNVRFLPWAHDISGYFLSADCYVQSSQYEGWGLAVIEALSSELPVVMTDVGCAGEVVVNEKSGLVVPVEDSSRLADALSRVLGDHQLREHLIEGGKRSIENLPDKKKTYELYLKSWERALSL